MDSPEMNTSLKEYRRPATAPSSQGKSHKGFFRRRVSLATTPLLNKLKKRSRHPFNLRQRTSPGLSPSSPLSVDISSSGPCSSHECTNDIDTKDDESCIEEIQVGENSTHQYDDKSPNNIDHLVQDKTSSSSPSPQRLLSFFSSVVQNSMTPAHKEEKKELSAGENTKNTDQSGHASHLILSPSNRKMTHTGGEMVDFSRISTATTTEKHSFTSLTQNTLKHSDQDEVVFTEEDAYSNITDVSKVYLDEFVWKEENTDAFRYGNGEFSCALIQATSIEDQLEDECDKNESCIRLNHEENEGNEDTKTASSTYTLEEDRSFECSNDIQITRSQEEVRRTEKIERRKLLPISKGNRKGFSLWGVLKHFIGKDLSRVSMPVLINEPLSLLQRISEDMEYVELLRLAATAESPALRLAWVAVFACTPFSAALGRISKPFNPLLGETFELSHYNGFRFLAEQVSHHPPVSSYHCSEANPKDGESKFKIWGSCSLNASFGGNSVTITIAGAVNLELKTIDGTLERYVWHRPQTVVHNIFLGSPWLEMSGEMVIRQYPRNAESKVTFLPRSSSSVLLHPSRWFHAAGSSSLDVPLFVDPTIQENENHPLYRVDADELESPRFPLHRIEGEIYDVSSGQLMYSLGGCWSQILWVQCSNHERRFRHRGVHHFHPHFRNVLWVPRKQSPLPKDITPADVYHMTETAMMLNQPTVDYDPAIVHMPPTDSRRRPDQRYCEMGQLDKAQHIKLKLEENQRERALMACKSSQPRSNHYFQSSSFWTPRWFSKVFDPLLGQEEWVFTGEYWAIRDANDAFANCADIFDV